MKKLPLLILALLSTNLFFSQNNSNNYLGSKYLGNYVWAGAMNLAWNELNENILHDKLKLDTDELYVLQMVDKLNNPVFSKNDLDEASYYVKSGYGQETVNTINKETRKKFPNKSFDDLTLRLNPSDIISYAYFLKETAYKNVFEKGMVSFNSVKVKGFFAKNKPQKENIKVLHYENDEKFIIRIQLKDDNDYLIFAKGYPMNDPKIVIDEINSLNKIELESISYYDVFSAPFIKLDYRRDYDELLNINLLNKGFEGYQIQKMFEKIKFKMDEKGARVENEAVIVLGKSINLDLEKPRKFELNKSFWIVMQRKGTLNPYFILGLNNTNLMEKE